MWTFTLIVLVIAVLALGAVALQLLKLRMSPPVYRALTNDEFPPHAMNLLQPMARELGASGMIFAGLQHERRSTGEDSWQAVFRNEDGSVWAVCETFVVAKQDKTRLVLQSYFADGSVVLTSSGTYADISVPPNWRLVQKSFDTCGEQLKAHHGSILGLGRAAERVHLIQSAAELRDRYTELGRAEHEHLRERGYLVPTASDPKTLRFSWLRIPWLSLRVLWMVIPVGREEAKRAEKQRKQLAQPGTPSPEATPETRRLELYREGSETPGLLAKLGWTGKGLVFLLSMIAFMALFYFRGTLELSTLGWVVVILIIHELGHALTMRLFGYRNVQIFFIPFLGAAAAGTKKRVPAWQEFWVVIMGPLPGLVGGWLIMGWSMLQPEAVPAWLEEFALWSVIINGFNLLPFLPLDGGRIVETLLFNRLPSFRVVFIILGGIALLPLALLSWWFLFLAIIMFMTVPEAIMIAGMSHWVRLNLNQGDSEDEALLKTFQIIEHTGNAKVYGKPTWPAFVDRMVQMGCGKQMGFFGTTAALGLYAMLIGLPILLGAAVALKAGWDHAGTEQELTDRIAVLEAKVTWPATAVSEQTRASLDATVELYRDTLGGEDLALGDPGEDIGALMTRTIAEQQRATARFTDAVLPIARKIRWDEVPGWIAEDDSGERQEIVSEMVQTLISEAASSLAQNKNPAACRDLTVAYWAITSCEPRQSFSFWQAWLELEWDCLHAIEELAAGNRLDDGTRTWLASALSHGPQPHGSKIALLCLYDAGRIYSAFDDSMAVTEGDTLDGESSSADIGLDLLSKMFIGVHIDDHLAMADFWASQSEATEVPAGELDDVASADEWNDSIRRSEQILRYRQLGALVLSGQAAPGAAPVLVRGKTASLMKDSTGSRWVLEPADEDEFDQAVWRLPAPLSPRVLEMTEARPGAGR